MATARPRTAGLGVRRQSMRVYNEPFNPNVEERDENEAHILLLELPDFSQQHVKVKIEKEERIVVVTGDRNVGNNRLLILDKTFPIPQDCVIEMIDHKLQNGVLTITMPKQTTAAAAVAPPLKEPEQTTPEKEREEISPENTTPPPKEPEQTTPEKDSEKISPENATPPPKEPEQTTPQKGGEEISSENAAPPETKEEIKQTVEENKGKSAELQKQASAKAEEEAPTVKSPAEGGSGEAKTTPDEKISSPDQKLTEKKEIENQNGEKGKESKTEEVGKNREEPKIGTGSRSPGATGVGKLAGGYTVRRMPLPVTASLAAAVVTAVAAYFAYAYYGLSFGME